MPRRIFMPHYGEFGFLVMNYLPFVYKKYQVGDIICCQMKHRCLFPPGAEFYHGWENPIPDQFRVNNRTHDAFYDKAAAMYDRKLERELKGKYSCSEVIYLYGMSHPWFTKPEYAPITPEVRPVLLPVDVTIAARFRRAADIRNYPQWPLIVSQLQKSGIRVGVVGDKALTVKDINWDAMAWDHPDGDCAGTIDLWRGSKIFLTAPTGLLCLAAILKVPTIVFEKRHHDGGLKVMLDLNPSWVKLPDSAWLHPKEILDATRAALGRENQ